ncbi:3733_t:CDS:1, partial [Funneliformis geosporum]
MINDKNEILIEKEIDEEFNSNSFATLNSIYSANDIRAKWKL